jgi:TetR/AcrR family transcriptional regulator, repressor for uid operon
MSVQQPEPIPGSLRSCPPVDADTRQRILAATAEVLGRKGVTKLSLTEVALEACVSRPTLYRWFASKEDLIAAFGMWERESYERGVADATAGLTGRQRLDAALKFIVAYQHAYPGLRMVDVEPALVIERLARVIPLMRERLRRLLPASLGEEAAAAAVRVAVSHYLVRSDDDDQFLAQLRHAVGFRGNSSP